MSEHYKLCDGEGCARQADYCAEHSPLVAAYSEQISRLTAELDAARKAMRQMAEKDSDGLEYAHVASMRYDLDVMRDERDAVMKERDALAEQNIALCNEVNRLTAELEAMTMQAAKFQDERNCAIIDRGQALARLAAAERVVEEVRRYLGRHDYSCAWAVIGKHTGKCLDLALFLAQYDTAKSGEGE